MTGRWLPVARPRLVRAERVLPYLREIDASRTYSNFGPLVQRFEDRLCTHFGLPAGGTVSVANCTVGLSAALMELALPGKTLCLMPSWTFCASAHAVVAAGLRPYFVDVDPWTWQITPESIANLPEELISDVAAVMPVAAFGAPVDGRGWDRFTAATGLPVVIDAAAGFDSLTASATPAVVSLHATKALGVGEGGFVACMDATLGASIRSRVNFGFAGARRALSRSINGKMSEYSAAVGLASLDVWSDTRQCWANLRDLYRSTLASAKPLWFSGATEQSWVTATFVVSTHSANGEVQLALKGEGIDSRTWWESGCHREPAFADCGFGNMSVTEHFARHSVGLPLFPDMKADEVEQVVEALAPHLGDRGTDPYSVYPIGDASNGVRE